MRKPDTRFLKAGLVMLIATWAGSSAHAQDHQAQEPLLTRIFMATIGAPDVDQIEKAYTSWLGYQVRRRGKVAVGMAESWGTPNSAGRPFILLSSEASPEVYLRVIQTDPVQDAKSTTASGWNAFEIVVDDLDKLNAGLNQSPFRRLAEVRSLGRGAETIRSLPVIGPAGEVLYFTTEAGSRDKSPLPARRSQVDRPIAFVLVGSDIVGLQDFYTKSFKLQIANGGMRTLPVRATHGPVSRAIPQALAQAAEPANGIEFDRARGALSPRAHGPGLLPPGNAMATFSIRNFSDITVALMKPPANNYGPRRSAAFVGPAGEITELIDEPKN